MPKNRKFRLIETEWPEFGRCPSPPQQPLSEFRRRIDHAMERMERSGLTHLVVYGDREHFANLMYLTGFDPRFEEALCILRPGTKPLLLVGNEGMGHLPVSPLFSAGLLRVERYQPFSLISQPRNQSRFLREILREEAITHESIVGCVGWKYFTEEEQPEPGEALELPGFVVDALRELAGKERVHSSTALFMNPNDGIRTRCGRFEIAYFEYSNILASEGVKNMIFGAKEGMLDYELVSLARLSGEPLGAHPSVKTAATRHYSLASPVGGVIRRGEPLSMSLCYWGSNSCRAGWAVAGSDELPEESRQYVQDFAGPYFEVVASWLEALKIGADAKALTDWIFAELPFERFGIFLNPGHLIHLDEWVSSPFSVDSKVFLQSGMAIQIDIIPKSPVFFSSRMEDGVVLADATLRSDLKSEFPECFERCQARRDFLERSLGIHLSEDVLPLSNISALVPPYFFRPNLVFALDEG